MRIPFISRRRAREEALAWLARLKRGLRLDEGPKLISWLSRRSHRTLIAKAAVEWHGPEVLAVLSEIFPIDPASLEPRRGRHPATAAAIFAGIVVFPVAFVFVLHMLGVGSHLEDWYATTPAATRRVSLQDGTRVALNRGTAISVLYWEHIRSVFLTRGEALFTVVSQPYRPFDVQAAGRHFEADSATFDVSLTGQNRVSVIVLAGTVTVSGARVPTDGSYYDADPRVYQPIRIEPLQMLVIEPDEESGQRLTEQDVRARLAWRGGP
jgi:transmembrane sensor